MRNLRKWKNLNRVLLISISLNQFLEANDKVQNILGTHCVDCHNPKGKAAKVFGDVKNTNQLILNEAIVAGDASQSKLIQSIESGDMPPKGAHLSQEEVTTLKDWINAMPKTEPRETSCRSVDSQLDEIRNDLESIPEASRQFIRYISISNSTSRIGRRETYDAVNKTVNSLSKNEKIVAPKMIGQHNDLARIDIRDYGWSEYDWYDLQENNPQRKFQEEFFRYGKLDEKDILHSLKSDMPIINADYFVHESLSTDNYYQLMDLYYVSSLNSAESFSNITSLKAGIKQSGVSSQNRIVTRIGSIEKERPRYVWKSSDFARNTGDANIFKHPMTYVEDGGEIIFKLPNGLHGYALADSRGDKLQKAPINIVSDPNRADKAITAAISCFQCHSQGLLPLKSDVYSFLADKNSALKVLSQEEYEKAKRAYVSNEELKKNIDSDNASYLKALSQLGGEANMESVTALFNAYEMEVNYRDTLCSLGLNENQFDSVVNDVYHGGSDHGDLQLLRNKNAKLSREGLLEASKRVIETHLKYEEQKSDDTYKEREKLIEELRKKRKTSQNFINFEKQVEEIATECKVLYEARENNLALTQESGIKSLELLVDKLFVGSKDLYSKIIQEGLLTDYELLPEGIESKFNYCASNINRIVRNFGKGNPELFALVEKSLKLNGEFFAERISSHPDLIKLGFYDFGDQHHFFGKLDNVFKPVIDEIMKKYLEIGMHVYKNNESKKITWINNIRGHHRVLMRYNFDVDSYSYKSNEEFANNTYSYFRFKLDNISSYEMLLDAISPLVPDRHGYSDREKQYYKDDAYSVAYNSYVKYFSNQKHPLHATELPRAIRNLKHLAANVSGADRTKNYSDLYLKLLQDFLKQDFKFSQLIPTLSDVFPPKLKLSHRSDALLYKQSLDLISKKILSKDDPEAHNQYLEFLVNSLAIQSREIDRTNSEFAQSLIDSIALIHADAMNKAMLQQIKSAQNADQVLNVLNQREKNISRIDNFTYAEVDSDSKMAFLYNSAFNKISTLGARSDSYLQLASHLNRINFSQRFEGNQMTNTVMNTAFKKINSANELIDYVSLLQEDANFQSRLSYNQDDNYNYLLKNYYNPIEAKISKLNDKGKVYSQLANLYLDLVDSPWIKNAFEKSYYYYRDGERATASQAVLDANFTFFNDLMTRGLKAFELDFKERLSPKEVANTILGQTDSFWGRRRSSVDKFTSDLVKISQEFLTEAQVKRLKAEFVKTLISLRKHYILTGSTSYDLYDFDEILTKITEWSKES